MTTDVPDRAARDAVLPRWRGITEPVTAVTDLALGAMALVLGARLGYAAAAEHAMAGLSLAAGLLATALAAMLGAGAHSLSPAAAPRARAWLWRATLSVIGMAGAATIASVAFFAARGGVRTAILVFAGVKLVAYAVAVTRRPEFRVAAADYAGALAVLLAGAVYAAIAWRAPGMGWLAGGVGVSLAAGVVQARRVVLHRHFNHNDLYHVIQMLALYLFYRGGVLLVDR